MNFISNSSKYINMNGGAMNQSNIFVLFMSLCILVIIIIIVVVFKIPILYFVISLPILFFLCMSSIFAYDQNRISKIDNIPQISQVTPIINPDLLKNVEKFNAIVNKK
jgi:FtsH-binding integral membrane protein